MASDESREQSERASPATPSRPEDANDKPALTPTLDYFGPQVATPAEQLDASLRTWRTLCGSLTCASIALSPVTCCAAGPEFTGLGLGVLSLQLLLWPATLIAGVVSGRRFAAAGLPADSLSDCAYGFGAIGTVVEGIFLLIVLVNRM